MGLAVNNLPVPQRPPNPTPLTAMTSYSNPALRKTRQAILSVPFQVLLFLSLGSLSLWMVYFSAYPATHNTMHQTRHHTLGVGCH